MNAAEIKAMMAEIAPVIREYVDAEVAPLKAELAELRAREIVIPEPMKGDPGDPGRDGADCDMEAVASMIDEAVSKAVAALPAAEPGKDGMDGKDADMDLVRLWIDDAAEVTFREKLGLAIAELPPPEKGDPGKDCDMEEVARMVADAVKSAVEALPAPKDGDPGKDGLGLANALIDRDGCLVLTMTDGSSKNLGPVVGKDGDPGKDGQDGETFTLDDFDIEPLDERSIKLKFTRGKECHSFELTFPVVIDAGVWREDGHYVRGDGVTWAGSYWIAQRDAPGKPDTADSGWRLSVKRGRDGRDAK